MQKGEIEIYKTSNGTEIQVHLDNETIWLDAHLIARLFEVNRPAIVKHIQNIYKAGELDEISTCSILEQVQATRFLQWSGQQTEVMFCKIPFVN